MTVNLNDVQHVNPSTYLRLSAWETTSAPFDGFGAPMPIRTRINVDLAVDDRIIERASGATLGEALFNLGALMIGERLAPLKMIAELAPTEVTG